MQLRNPEVSVCIITKNEEKNIENCIRSVEPIASEIIIVDTGSVDRTIEIAKKFTELIFQIPWEDDFSKARNYAIAKAKYPFIISIDADEVIQNPESITNALRNADSNTGGWLINSISFAKRKTGNVFDTFATKLIRIFRNHPKIRFRGIIHEQIHESILEQGFEIKDSGAIFLHFGYSLSPEEMKTKQLRNLNLLLSALKNEPTNAYLLFQTAKTYLALNLLEEAERYINEALRHSLPDSAVRHQSLNYGGIIAFQLGNFEKAIQLALESLSIVPKQSFANFILGETYSALTEYNKALQHYYNMEEALQNPSSPALIGGDYFLPFVQLYFRIGRCYIGLGNPKKAEFYFRKALDNNNTDINSLRGLVHSLLLQNEFSKAKTEVRNFSQISPELNEEITQLLKQIDQYELEQKRITQTSIKKEEFHPNISGKYEIKSPTKRPFVSLSMIVKNEEKFLPGCLESVKEIVEEIVIVDTGSTDKTIDIAKGYGAKVYFFEWRDDFSAARNESLKHCTGEWIIYLDADERIKSPAPNELLELLRNSESKLGAYYCLIESEHYQMDGSTEVHRGGYPRIFRNLGYPKIKFIGRVHEQIAPSIFENGMNMSFSNIIIQHLGYNQSREIMEEKIRRNYRMLIQHVKEEPLNGYAWFQLGQTLAQMSLFNEAEKSIRMAIETKTLAKSVLASACSTLAKMVGNKGKYDEALFWAEKSLENAPNQIYAMHIKAYALLYLGRFEEAIEAFHIVLRRLKEQSGIPLTGFDILIPEHIVLNGLQMAENKIIPK
ncbi:MAG: glycosyltransferase [Ignavibacteria bacterium]|nr:glycosyltransferase [Ignavibacteria bacterium]